MESDLPPASDLVERYLRRIGHRGRVGADLETLEALCWGHVRAIPFENLDVLLQRPIRLDAPSLAAKLLDDQRGGYCFEHNTLFATVLEELGFRVSRLAARVRWLVPPERITARAHMLLRVNLAAGPLIVDVGFGGPVPPAPLWLCPGLEQPTRLESYRLLESAGAYTLQLAIPGAGAAGVEWRALYTFTLDEQHAIDYEVANHYMATHPDSHFRRNLVVARCADEGRITLRGRELGIHQGQGPTQRQRFEGDEALLAALEAHFGLRLPSGSRLPAGIG
jgi:N-hydroxyarylamine O-acetyltransferase